MLRPASLIHSSVHPSWLPCPVTASIRCWLCLFASCGLKLDDEAARVAVGMRLGLNRCVPHQCQCGAQVDARGIQFCLQTGTGKSISAPCLKRRGQRASWSLWYRWKAPWSDVYRQRQVAFARFLFCFKEFMLLCMQRFNAVLLHNSFVKDDQPE